MNEDHPGVVGAPDWEATWTGDALASPFDRDLVALAQDLTPGTALDLGCGAGQNSIRLVQRGRRVHGVDIAGGAVERAEAAAGEAGAEATFEMPVVIVVARPPGRRAVEG